METTNYYNNVIRLCAHRGISITALAKKLGLSKSTTTDWKRKGAQPQAKTLKAVADYFGVTVDHLLSESVSVSPIERMENPIKGDADMEKNDQGLGDFINAILAAAKIYYNLSGSVAKVATDVSRQPEVQEVLDFFTTFVRNSYTKEETVRLFNSVVTRDVMVALGFEGADAPKIKDGSSQSSSAAI